MIKTITMTILKEEAEAVGRVGWLSGGSISKYNEGGLVEDRPGNWVTQEGKN